MTRKQFAKWVDDTNRKASIDEGLNKVNIIENCGTRRVIVVDMRSAETGMSECRDAMSYDRKKGIAIAYARLRGLEVPKIEEEHEPEFRRAEKGDAYYIIDLASNARNADTTIVGLTENGDRFDDAYAKVGNYFLTRERAEEVLDKIKTLLFLEKLHDIYCPDYKPDWKDSTEQKFYVSSYIGSEFRVSWCTSLQNPTCVYFPSLEIAGKVADILNSRDGAQT